MIIFFIFLIIINNYYNVTIIITSKSSCFGFIIAATNITVQKFSRLYVLLLRLL